MKTQTNKQGKTTKQRQIKQIHQSKNNIQNIIQKTMHNKK